VQPRRSVRLAAVGLVIAALVTAFFISGASAALDAQAQVASGPVREAQVLSEEKTGVSSPVGLAFSSTSNAFYVVGAQPGALPETDVVKLTLRDRVGSTRLAAAVQDPINMAFDARRNRLLLLGQASELFEVQAGGGGDLDPATLSRRDIARFGLSNPQGMAVDPASGTVFILDAALPRIVRVELDPAGGFDAAVTSEIDLRPAGLRDVRGLALDPSSGHLYLGSGRTLVELATDGVVVASRDLSGFALSKSEGLVFAPSGDQTDDPSQLSLFLADSGTAPTGSGIAPSASTKPAPSAGQIMEVSLAAPITTASIEFTSSLVNSVNLGGLSPPSTDPSGITYVPTSNRLLISDGEVEETVNGITHFQGANVWELNRNGLTLNRTANISNVPPGVVVPVTNEPAGAGFNPTNGHYYFSADDGKKVFDVNPGADGLVGTAGDTVVSFDTLSHGNSDPEGITYDTFSGNLFVADGLNREVYRYTTGGSLVGHFDTASLGVEDPEAVEFNPDSGTLFILSDALNTPNPNPIIVETTTGGTLVRTISAAASNAIKPAGLAYGPPSTGSATPKRFYIVDRGIDNNNDPNAVDGKLYEMTTPAANPPGNTPPSVNAGTDQSVTLPASANLNGTVTDDGLPTPPSLTTAWSQVSGPGAVTFGNASMVDTTASVPIPGIYVVRLTANDGQFSASDEATLIFSGSGSAQTVDVRVNAAGDDAEEYAGGIVQKGDGDLDMMTDATGTGNPKVVVGMRFNSMTIPPGASISSAYLQFQADEADSVATSLTIKGQDAVNPVTFTTAGFDISSRPTTSASASWSPAPWVGIGDAGLAQRAPGLAGIIQEIVNKPGWASGNSLVLLVTGSGERVAVAHNQIATAAPLLHVEYSGSAPGAPQITSYEGGASASVSAAENQTSAADVDAVDPDVGDTLTYSISGGADQSKFSVVPTTGVVTFTSAPNFESPTDVGGNNVYDVTVSVSDGHGGLDTQAIAVTVLNVNEFPPVITSNGGGDTASVSPFENQTAVTDVDATDADLATVVYAISGGADALKFAIVPATGVLTFVSAPDFENPTDAGGDGTYDVVVEASDGSLSDTQAIAVTVADVVEGSNQAPVVDAGPDQAITLPANATLDGTVSDDGLPNPPGAVTTTWSMTSGPGTVTFGDASAVDTTASFSVDGTYVLSLTASDSELSTPDELTVTVNPVPNNQPPSVSAGLDQTITLPANATLDGTVSDDGLPNPPGAVTTTWSKTSGPGTVTFGNASAVDTTASFSVDGVYVLRLTADDGDATPFDELTVTVNPATTQSLDIRVSVGADDAEQRTDNTVVLGNADLDMMIDGTEANSVVGTRFRAVTIPPGASITSAYLQFQAAAVHSVATSLTIRGHAADNASVFTTVNNDLSSRPTTTASAAWTVDPWLAVDAAGAAQRSPSLTGIIQQIVSRPGWASGNSLVLLVTGSGTRVARSQNSLMGVAAPLLHVEWAAGGNQPPSVGAGPDQPVTLPASATLDGTVSDDGLPNPPGAVTTTWSKTSGPGTVTFGNASAVDTTATFSLAGTYVLRLTASDSVLSAFDELTVTVTDPPPPGSPLYFSLLDPATVGGIAAENEDIVFFNGASFSLAFDGSDVGITSLRIDAFSWVNATSILLSFDAPGTVPGIAGTTDDSDVVLFTSTSLGTTTAGTFSVYFDGSDVGLTTNAEDVDAVELRPNGNVLISTIGAVTVTGVSGDDKDLLAFAPTSTGAVTAGTFSWYFDGSDVGLTTTGEDVDAVAVDTAGKIYLSTVSNFSVTGISGEDDDVFVFTPILLGATTAGTFSSTLYFDGSVYGLTANDVFAIDLP
jgi:uncharacterized protein YjiK